MYSIILTAHNLVRWLVVAIGVVTAIRAWRGFLMRTPWTDADMQAGKGFVNAISLQFLLGLALYATSPLIRQGMADMATAMRTSGIRYFMVEHTVMMLTSIALAHIGLARVKRATTDQARFQNAATWWGIAAASVIGFIPWNRPLWPW
jgi:hypothetical protein